MWHYAAAALLCSHVAPTAHITFQLGTAYAAILEAVNTQKLAAAAICSPIVRASATTKHAHGSGAVEVDVACGSGNPQQCLLLDPLCGEGVLLEDSQDFTGAGTAAALAAERDEAFVAMRAMQYEHWQQRQEYLHKLAQLSSRIQQLEQQQAEHAGTSAYHIPTTSSSSRDIFKPSHSSSNNSKKTASQHCTVQFSITCATEFGQRLWLVGDAAALGSWDVGCGLRLKWEAGSKWVGSVDLDVGCTRVIKYKAVLQCGPGQFRWAAGQDHELVLTAASHSVEHEFA